MRRAIKNDDIIAIQKFLNKDVNAFMRTACFCGRKDLVDEAISKGADDWKYGLIEACRGGHLQLVDFMIYKSEYSVQLNYGLKAACEENKRNIVDYLINRGCKYCFEGFIGACLGGHRPLVDYMISEGAYNWDVGLESACEGGHRDLVDLMISKGSHDWNRGLLGACKGGHRDLVDLMISKGADDLDMALSYANEGGSLNIVEFLISQGANLQYFCYEKPHICEYLLNFYRMFRAPDYKDYINKFKYLDNVLGSDVCREIKYFL